MHDGDDRRRAPRLPVELHVEFRHLGRPAETYAEVARNLSAGGAFIDTSVGLPVGTEVALEITPGRGAKPIRMRAEVMRVEEEVVSTGSRVTARVRGMGLRFLDSEPSEVARLLSLSKQMTSENKVGSDRSK